MPTKTSPAPKYYLLVFAILFLGVVGIVSVYLLNFSSLRDMISNLTYTPPAAVTELEQKITLTAPAQTTFRATRPSLEDQAEFNQHCNSHNVDVSVLGCYTGGHIYIYNISSQDLAGIVESTAAHEFLHAAWDRLPESEKTTVSNYLNQVYAEHRDALAEDLNHYDAADQLDELHSRIGTQITDLPEYLEKYYANYFTDQNAVVAYYTSYITPFNQLKSQMASLKTELDELKATIDADTGQYYTDSKSLSAAIEEFNACASQSGCFANVSEFNLRRAELVDEQSRLETVYNNINTVVDQYNQKVEAYNHSILRTEQLQNAINSNAPPAEIQNSTTN